MFAVGEAAASTPGSGSGPGPGGQAAATASAQQRRRRESLAAVVEEYHRSLGQVAEQQERVLERLLRKDAECEYLRRHGFRGQTDAETFRRLLPVIEYDAIEDDVRRIMDGDVSPILTCEPVDCLNASSGTSSGKRKVFPVTRVRAAAKKAFETYLEALATLVPEVGEAASTGVGMYFWNAGASSTTPGGLPVAAGTTYYLTGPDYARVAHAYASPRAVVQCRDARQATYCHLLCGLARAREVTHVGALFASGLVVALNVLREEWPRLAADVEAGAVSPAAVPDAGLRAAVAAALGGGGDPAVAALVRRECGGGGEAGWEGIVTRLWPRVRVVCCVATGSMLQYVDRVRWVTGGKVPVSSQFYVGSEGVFGINPDLLSPPEDTAYVMLHNLSTYFEFVRKREEGEEAAEEEVVVGLAGVKEGEVYELVVTNGEGLWRYRVGDLLQCVGTYHGAPKFKFLARKNVLLSVHTDKTDETELTAAVAHAARAHLRHGARLYDFTSCVGLDSLPARYVLFWELYPPDDDDDDDDDSAAAALAAACLAVEAALGEPYRRGRNQGAIGALEVRLVHPGTFDGITRQAMDRGSVQYKVPRALRPGHPDLAVLEAAVVLAARSPRAPPHPTLNPDGDVVSDI